MKNNERKLYVGIDIHSREHKVALVPIALLESPGTAWRKVKSVNIRNNISDFEHLDAAIKSHISSTEEVAIAVDHTGVTTRSLWSTSCKPKGIPFITWKQEWSKQQENASSTRKARVT